MTTSTLAARHSFWAALTCLMPPTVSLPVTFMKSIWHQSGTMSHAQALNAARKPGASARSKARKGHGVIDEPQETDMTVDNETFIRENGPLFEVSR